ncbi:MAG: TRAP transporter substrate-binding protein [Thermodesulfobacteriota bacterium]
MSHRLVRIGLCLAALLILAAPALAAEPVKLTYSNFFPPAHAQSRLAQAWCEEIAQRTGGRVVFQYLPGATLLKAEQTFDGVVNGMADVGMSCFAYTRGRFPVMEVVDLPLGYPNGPTATAVANRVAAELKPAELKQVEVMYLHAHGPGWLHTKKRPVRSLDDMAGLKLRATGTSANLVKALGGVPVALAMPETYQSLEKGVVDGSVYPLEANQGWKLGEVVNYATDLSSVGYTTCFFVVMNQDRWRGLPAEVRAVIAQVNQEWITRHGQAWDEADAVGLKFFLDQPGRERIALDPAEAERWRQAAEPVLSEYEARLRARGVDGAGALAAARKALADAVK